jgi:coproporphyrinogen III oxidase-like Fe-S oxidoreductase
MSERTVHHLYVHLPFCAHRCGYCDFVTISGRARDHRPYIHALVTEFELERHVLAPELETVYLGGGTPTFTEPSELGRLLHALPPAAEVTVEANPETVTPELALLLRRRAVRRAFYHLRDASFDNISLDLLYGIPGQSASDLDRDLSEVLALEPEHLSCYELEAKPGTRFTYAHGAELTRQAEAMETYFERVVETLTAAGYRWYETANFCLGPDRAAGRDLRARHNLGYWLGRDYLGIGLGAVSTIEGVRRRNTPRLAVYVTALEGGSPPAREVETLDRDVRSRERLMLRLRLDEPLLLEPVESAVDHEALGRLVGLGLVRREGRAGRTALTLTPRGRLLGGGVTAELLA